MTERTKDVDSLRRLAELLRQANANATEGSVRDTKGNPKIKKLRHHETKVVKPHTGAPGRPKP